MTSTPPRFTVLTFGDRATALAQGLEAFGTSVIPSSDQANVLAALESLRQVSALLVSSDIGRAPAANLLKEAKNRFPALPIIWLGEQLGGAPLGDFRSSPDALLHEPITDLAVHETMHELLRGLYTTAMADLLVNVVSAALRDGGKISPTPSAVGVDTRHRLVNEVNTIVAFCGAAVSGRLLISAEEATLLAIYQKLVASDAQGGPHQAEDLAGEIANLAVGKLKFAFDQLGVACEIGTPLLVGRVGTILRATHGRPSLVVEFEGSEGIVRSALTIDRCEDEALEKLSHTPQLLAPEQDAEVCFF